MTVRQQPETAKGVMFVSLEDETGGVQLIVWPRVKVAVAHSAAEVTVDGGEGCLAARGGEVRNLIARYVQDLTPLLGGWVTQTREFR